MDNVKLQSYPNIMRLLISLWFITFCVALLISEKQASLSPKPNVFLVGNHILKPHPEKVLFQDPSEPSSPDCDSNEVPLKIPTISDIIPTDPEPIENFEFDWAGFSRDSEDYDEKFQKLEKRAPYHVTGDFDKGYLKHVHLYPPSCACQTKVTTLFCPTFLFRHETCPFPVSSL